MSWPPEHFDGREAEAMQRKMVKKHLSWRHSSVFYTSANAAVSHAEKRVRDIAAITMQTGLGRGFWKFNGLFIREKTLSMVWNDRVKKGSDDICELYSRVASSTDTM